MTQILAVPTPVSAPSHEHAWFTRSAHRTSQGMVCYVRCDCGIQRIDLQSSPLAPPSALSREVGAAARQLR